MSGVFGYAGAVGAPIAVAGAMAQRLCHTTYHVCEIGRAAPIAALGRRHIGLLNRAPQPIVSACGELMLCLAGEFYHQERRRAALVAAGELVADAGDAALALAVYRREGTAGLAALEGAFTVAVWDGRERALVLVNDRFGLYPHYYAHAGGAFAFAPEIRAVLCADSVPRHLDETAICEFLRFQQLLGDKTWIEDVRLLPPASVLRYAPDSDRLTLTRSWEWAAIPELGRIGFDEAVDEAARLFQRAIDTMTAPPQRPGIFLSGGLDGRIILAFSADRAPVSTLTFGAPQCRDVVYATRLAQRAGVPHRLVALDSGGWVQEWAPLHMALTEGMHSFIHMHGITALPAAREQMDVNLSGWDGGTTMGAFAVLEEHTADRFYRLPPDEVSLVQRLYAAFCRETTWPGLDEAEAATLLSGGGRERLRVRAFESLRAEIATGAGDPPHRRVDYFVIRNLIRRSLQNQIVTQRSAIEVRCPYFDYDFVAFMYGLPDSVRATPEFRRRLLTRRAPALARVPYEKDDRLPHSNNALRQSHALLQRGKSFVNRRLTALFPERTRLYADYEQYLRGDLRDWAEGILFDPRTLERGLFEPGAVRSLWRQHVAGKQLWTVGKVAPLISIELTLRWLLDERETLELPQPRAAAARVFA